MVKLSGSVRVGPDQKVTVSTRVLLFLLALTPAITLSAFWIGGVVALTFAALAMPLFVGCAILLPASHQSQKKTPHKRALNPQSFDELVGAYMAEARENAQKSAVFYVQIDDYSTIADHHGEPAMDAVRQQMLARLGTALRDSDVLGAVDNSTMSVCLSPQPFLDLEICLQLAGRMTNSLSEPYSVDNTMVYLGVSIGFCQLGRETASAKDTSLDPVNACAKTALAVAQLSAPGSIRAYSADLAQRRGPTASDAPDPLHALENGEIVPWFQPQISTDTGKITGFEALARWIHPKQGPISPADFTPQLEAAGQMGRLSEVILYHTLTAIKAWDQAGFFIGHVGVNFSSAELNDPHIVEKLSWELDRFELSPERVAIEILETVVSQGPDDVITRNIKGLHELGCHIDLDDFGTGHASLTSIRRFGVGRIKIDRSFVMKADCDPEQQRMIKAILTMAEKLDLETLAEGVETVGEHSLLAQLGCTHVQGFGIGRPMPFDQTLQWIREHNSKLQAPPDIGRTVG